MKTWASSFTNLSLRGRTRIRTSRGFTIVELLIVIVVIAVLAAITIVSYNGIQQRANNTAIIDAASRTSRMIQAYIAANGTYPIVAGLCVTATSGCANTSTTVLGNNTFDTTMASIGTLPRSTPTSGTNRYGIIYDYTSTRTLNGQTQPVILLYWLPGINQQCGVGGITDSAGPAMSSSTTGYTSGDSGGSGKTACIVSIPGPSA